MTVVGRAERLLPYACIMAAVVLFASQLLTLFEFTPPGAEPLLDRSAIDDHGHPLFLVSAFAILATIAAVWVPSKPAAVAVGAMGLIALLFFLLTDLPDAGAVGTLDDARQSFIDAEAIPQEGFWLELLGSLGLALSGIALATMSPEQLAAMRPGAKRRLPEQRPFDPDAPGPNGAKATPRERAPYDVDHPS